MGTSSPCGKILFPISPSTFHNTLQLNVMCKQRGFSIKWSFLSLFATLHPSNRIPREICSAHPICGQAVVHVGIICENVNEKTSVRSQIQQTPRWGRQEGWRFKRHRETRVDFRWLMWRYIVHYVRINHRHAGTAFYRTYNNKG